MGAAAKFTLQAVAEEAGLGSWAQAAWAAQYWGGWAQAAPGKAAVWGEVVRWVGLHTVPPRYCPMHSIGEAGCTWMV